MSLESYINYILHFTINFTCTQTDCYIVINRHILFGMNNFHNKFIQNQIIIKDLEI